MYQPEILAALPDDPTVEEVRRFLPPFIAEEVTFDGWGDKARDAAADAQGVDRALALLAFDQGPMDMIDCWISHIDAKMIAHWTPERVNALKIRERITQMVWFRLEHMIEQREALRRAHAIMAMPKNMPQSSRIGWRSADLMWRLAGDTATDYNHYSKRIILSAVYGSSLMVFLGDESEGFAETRQFLDRRIENVMQFEKAKFQWRKRRENRPDLMRFLGRLRYPARQR